MQEVGSLAQCPGCAAALRPAERRFNAAQDHLLEASRAHVDRIVFDAFARAVDNCPDAGTAALLGTVLDLHALSVIETERAFFTEHAFLTARRAKAVTQEVNALCGELRPHARALVDGFGIPEGWLACPLLDGERAADAPAAPAPSDLAAVG